MPENASWGDDNRSAALRLITRPTPHGARFENRLPGADANAYLAVGGMLATGLDGIERGLAPPPLCTGNAALDESYTELPATLEDAVEVFEGSAFLRRAFGEPLRRPLRALTPGRDRSLARLAEKPDQRLGVRALFRDHLSAATPFRAGLLPLYR